ncbi:hypothetical protein PanWU01x14_080870 [Parasponia andersonii]|uniref:DUF1618 domain-containing protein n=1 Tax=Parasponia andersonii TaxID=3476 RepID=A0A2P5DAV5_PARAD|nr:hypothetical protein PanWU01x14_080870 [Parasponia andersonii]
MTYNHSRNMKGTKIARLGESRQRLVIVALDVEMENDSFTFSSWSLEDYNKGKWVCDYWVDVGSFDNIVTKQPNYLEVVAISPLDPRILCLNLGFALYLYNVKTKEVQLLHQYKHVNVYEYWQSYCHRVVPRFPPYIDPNLYLDVLSRERCEIFSSFNL